MLMSIEVTMGKRNLQFFRNEIKNGEEADFPMRERGRNEENLFLT